MTEQEELIQILKYDYLYPQKIVALVDSYIQREVSAYSHYDWYEINEEETGKEECYVCKTHFLYITIHWCSSRNSTCVSVFNHDGSNGIVFYVSDYEEKNIKSIIKETISDINIKSIIEETISAINDRELMIEYKKNFSE